MADMPHEPLDRKGRRALTPIDVASPAIVLGTAAVVIFVIRLTGGQQSELLPLIDLPVILAVVSCTFEITVAVGLCISVLYLFLLSPATAGFTHQEAVRAFTINAMAIVGAFYARRTASLRRGMELERERMLQSMEEKDALLNASQIVNAQDKFEHAITSALLLLPKLVPQFRSAAVFFTDETQRMMELFDVIGVGRSDLAFDRFSLTSRSLGWNPHDTQPLYLADTHEHPHARISRLDPSSRSIVCVPMRVPQTPKSPFGMLFVSSDRPAGFHDEQIALLQAFVDRIGFPLHKIRVQEGLEGLAFTDGMTGLYNFRYFRSHLEDELKRSVRYQRPLSLIILDLDDFKRVNDRFGHPVGDKLLNSVASIIRHTVRETDLPARYGGEEFVIISPETHAEDAAVLAERIRTAVEASQLTLESGEALCATISGGVATFPDHARGDAALLEAADAALYRAKTTGKNRVVTGSPLQ